MKIAPAHKSTRPYWHVDLKWIFGILLFLALGAALLLYNLQALTERERAVSISANIVASLFSRDGLDSEEGLEDIRRLAAASPEDKIAPIEQFPWVTITKDDVQNLSVRELRLKIFGSIAEVLYDEGLDGAAQRATDDPAEQEKFMKDAALLGVFTEATHDKLKQAFYVTALLSLVLAAGLVFFSHGWGRLVSPAVVLLLVSPIGALAALMIKNPPPDGDGPLTEVPGVVAESIGSILTQSYLAAAVLGIVLLVVALVGKVVQKILHRRSEKP